MYSLNPMEDVLLEYEKKVPRDELFKSIKRMVGKYPIHEILSRMAVAVSEYQTTSETEVEDEYWDKSWRALLNLARGTEKWFYSMYENE